MTVSKAQLKAKKKYESSHYWKPTVMIPRELEQAVRDRAGASVNGYIMSLIKADLEKAGEIKKGS